MFAVLGRRILDGKPEVFPARHEVGSQSPRAREEQSCSFSICKKTTHASTNEYRFNRQTCPGIQSVPTLTITSGVVLPIPPRSGAGGDLDNIDNPFWGTGPSRFLWSHFAFPSALSRPTHVAGGMAMAFVDDSFLPLKARSSFLSLY